MCFGGRLISVRKILYRDILLQKNRLVLFMLKCAGQSSGNLREVCYNAGRLFLGVILTEGHKEVVLSCQKLADVFSSAAKSVIC